MSPNTGHFVQPYPSGYEVNGGQSEQHQYNYTQLPQTLSQGEGEVAAMHYNSNSILHACLTLYTRMTTIVIMNIGTVNYQ